MYSTDMNGYPDFWDIGLWHRVVQNGNQNGGHEYDNLQNWFDMTSHEHLLLSEYKDCSGSH